MRTKTRQNSGKKRNIYFPDGSIDESKLRYVIYARKSNEEKSKQFLSVPRQIKKCKELAKTSGYKIVQVFEESASAAYAGNRPEFDKMVKGLEQGNFEGIITYAPDRLSRNMLEAGKILDMLVSYSNKKVNKENKLKKLAFVTGSFTNDANGRLVLAVQFGLATQYSQVLAKSVTDGMNTHAEAGKAQGNPKWGYIIDEKGDYIPDPKFFSIIQHGWHMILNGSSQKEVMDYWAMEDVHRMTKTNEGKDGEKVGPPSKSTVSRIFQDSIYYGVLVWDNVSTDLRGNGKFVPMVSKEEWDRVQFITESQKGGKGRKSVAKDRFLPLRGFVHCAGCGRVMTVSVGGKKNAKHKLVYYRCQNKQCPYEKNEVRGYEIFDQLYEILDNLKLTKNAYKQYEKAISDYRENELDNLRIRKNHLIGQKNYLVRKREKDSETVQKLANAHNVADSVFEDANAIVEEDDYNIEKVKEEIEQISQKLDGSEDLALSQQDFLDLIESAGKQMKNGNFVQKDAIARILLLNLKVDNEKRLIPIWNEAFKGLFSSRSFPSGDPGETRTLDNKLKRLVL